MPDQTERVTLRLPESALEILDTFVLSGEFASRSEVIRKAIREFVRSNAGKVLESQKAAVELARLREELEEAREVLERYK